MHGGRSYHSFISLRGLFSSQFLLIFVLLPGRSFPNDLTQSLGQDTAYQLEPLVVTAKKREETLNAIPGQITVFTQDTIEHAQIHNADDFAALTPSLTYINPGNPVETPLIIRGVGISYGVGEYSVGLFEDGVYQGADIYYSQDLPDVQRIEILKGPQTALYGKSTIAGAVNVIYNDPTPEPQYASTTTYGTDQLFRQTLVINQPFSDGAILTRTVWEYKEFDGFYTNEFNNSSRDSDLQHRVRLKLTAFPSDTLAVIPAFSYRKRDTDAYYYHQVANDSDYEGQPYDVDFPSFAEIEVTKGSLTLYQEFLETGILLTSISGGSLVKENDGVDIDYSSAPANPANPFANVVGLREVERRDFSQEIRLTSSDDARFKWLAGLYFYYLRNDLKQNISFNTLIPGFPQPDNLDSATTSHTYSAFGEFTFPIMDKSEIGLGLRYDIDKREKQNESGGPPRQEKSFDSLSPQGTITCFVSDKTLIYGSVALGYKAGGFNNGNFAPFDQEQSLAYEIGAKSDLFDNRLSFNGALFLTFLSDQQVAGLDIPSVTEFITNQGESKIYGGEVDISMRPSEALHLTASATVLSAEFTDFTAVAISPASIPGTVTFDGYDLPYIPKVEAVISADYTKQLNSQLTLHARGSYRYSGEKFWDNFNTAKQEAYHVTNVSVGVYINDIEIAGFVSNLFNEKYFTNYVPAYRFPFADSAVAVNGEPRLVGISVKAIF